MWTGSTVKKLQQIKVLYKDFCSVSTGAIIHEIVVWQMAFVDTIKCNFKSISLVQTNKKETISEKLQEKSWCQLLWLSSIKVKGVTKKSVIWGIF